MNAKSLAKRMGLAVLAAGALTVSTAAAASAQGTSQLPASAPTFVPATVAAPASNSVHGPVTDPAYGQYYGQLPQSQVRPTLVYVPAAVKPLVGQSMQTADQAMPSGMSSDENTPSQSAASHFVPSQYLPSLSQSVPAAATTPAASDLPTSATSNPGWQLYTQLFGSTPAEDNDE